MFCNSTSQTAEKRLMYTFLKQGRPKSTQGKPKKLVKIHEFWKIVLGETKRGIKMGLYTFWRKMKAKTVKNKGFWEIRKGCYQKE